MLRCRPNAATVALYATDSVSIGLRSRFNQVCAHCIITRVMYANFHLDSFEEGEEARKIWLVMIKYAHCYGIAVADVVVVVI